MSVIVSSASAVPIPGGSPQPSVPAAGQVLRAGEPITFHVQVPADAYSVWFVAATSPAVGANGALSTGVVDVNTFSPTGQPGLYSYTTSAPSAVMDHIGTVYWQAYLIDDRYDPDVYAEGPVLPITLTETRAPVVGAFGISNGKGLYLNPSPLPSGVQIGRFEELVRRSAERWSLQYLGLTTNPPGQRDRVNVIGFDDATTPGALGVTSTYLRPVFRVRRVCRIGPTAAGGRGRICRGVRVRAGRAKTGERDVQLTMATTWQQGPRRPSSREHDLESTIIHELGHFAGNVRHAFGCVNSPMVASLGQGEYWRDRDLGDLYACR